MRFVSENAFVVVIPTLIVLLELNVAEELPYEMEGGLKITHNPNLTPEVY
jgi:hypothetical protein